MTDRQLFRSLILDFAVGGTLGGIFAGLLLFLNIQHLWDAVQGSGAPKTLCFILIAGCGVNFGMGATITGFQFAVMGNETKES